MKQITEDYCSYEIAKLLKEKGFVGESEIGCRCGFYEQNKEYPSQVNLVYDDLNNSELEPNECLRFTHQMALKWLREVHKINIVIGVASDDNNLYSLWKFDIWNGNYSIIWGDKREKFNSYEEAVEAALLYVLKNLI